ncbi:TonB-dependent receptor domain-containing protein [Brevundimonas sp.]|uniref:TonB-dependent receptor domain-containing protein n=1 Tax=Brevundimonas sp. TaxID=1871086 RepID=UPI002D3B7E41|nr:TonB-dependent receptor [Brevundimonas sp.]HYC75201.1 TonB-dependent receptor [Brevundimonas sp.]
MLLKRKFLFGTTILAGVMAAAAPALAQESQLPGVNVTGQQGQEATEIEEVVVTGSRIRRDPVNSPTPLIQVQREDLLSTGQATVIDYLATIPALSNSLVPSDTTGSNLNDGGLEFANLRSLGSGRTLTLVDGRRHVGSAAGQLQVDVSTIPRLLIENIEIITGGASSVYGADAVSGVVNYILRKDFEGLEIDANWGQLVKDGAASTQRVSVLAGVNLFDDRLNLYAHAEYDESEEVYIEHVPWLGDGSVILPTDRDPTNTLFGPVNDGVLDTGEIFYDARRLDRPMWGSTTLANMQRPSPLSDPDVISADCSGGGGNTSANCFNVDPAYTYWFDGPTARLANFGTRIGVGTATSANRPWNIGGDGEVANATSFDQRSRTPYQESSRYQAGLTFQLTDNIEFYAEGKYTTEDTFDVGQNSFWDIYITDSVFACGGISPGVACNSGTTPGLISGTSAFTTRLDNAFLPANLRTAIQNNQFQRYFAPSAATPNDPGACRPSCGVLTAAPIADHRGFGIERTQTNNREVTRWVAALEGNWDSVAFIDNVNWTLSYVHGEMNNVNREEGPDAIRFGHAMDSVVDLAGIVNGTPGEIVCRVQLINAMGLPVREQNPNLGTNTPAGGFYTDPDTNPEVAGCVPLNVFGMGNQSQEAIDYITAAIHVRETNEQDSAMAAISGQLWDFWGAGPLGLAVGAEYRREYTEGVGRSADTAGRVLQLNTGADFLPAEYESEEWFAEMSLPLLRDSWMGEYAELSASYRAFDYTTAGEGDVYGVNLVYRPIQDITFKTSFNTSFRAPTLNENFRPFGQTFVNGFVDPCHTGVIAGFQGDDAAQVKANRIANCTELAARKGLVFDFAEATATQADDFRPANYAGIASVLGGNANLEPEESESFTFSTVLRPRMFPNLSLVLDYYEITVDNVIITPNGQFLANDCVSNVGLSEAPGNGTCNFVFRNNPNTNDPAFDAFKVGAPAGDPIGGFILAPINRSKLETRGLDFTVNYSLDTEEVFGRNWGTFNYSLGGLWLIDQKNFTDPANPNAFTDSTTSVFFPRVEFVSRLNWRPNDVLSLTWTADWQSSQDLNKNRDLVSTGNLDNEPHDWHTTGNFVRHDFSVRYDLRDDLTLRANVTNIFDTESPRHLGFASSFDPYGRRFNVGLNYRPW